MRDRLIELLDKKIYTIDMADSEAIWHSEKMEELADHLLSNGVIVPPFPVKVGDTIYRLMCRGVKDFFLREETIHIVDYHADAGVEVIAKFIANGSLYFPKVEKLSIGKTVFLTREEAEKALAERSENGK